MTTNLPKSRSWWLDLQTRDDFDAAVARESQRMKRDDAPESMFHTRGWAERKKRDEEK